MVSKKSESMKLMTTSTAVSSPSLAKKPKLNWPTSEKSGPANGSAGIVRHLARHEEGNHGGDEDAEQDGGAAPGAP